METVEIRKISASDIEAFRKISVTTFMETFAPFNTGENMLKYTERNMNPEKLLAELENSCSHVFLAELGKAVIGYLKVNFGQAQTEIRENNCMEIERIYVLKEYHGKEAGSLLFKKALDTAHSAGVDYIWLGVWEKNQRALSFYRKNGFFEFNRHVFMMGDEPQTDYLMKLELKNITRDGSANSPVIS
jgi:diamine N-acetyltransferase